jgi:hypothetical protein
LRHRNGSRGWNFPRSRQVGGRPRCFRRRFALRWAGLFDDGRTETGTTSTSASASTSGATASGEAETGTSTASTTSATSTGAQG